MMCSRLLKVKHEHGRLYNWTEKGFQWIISTYASALQVVLNHPAPVLLVMPLTVGVSGYLYVKIPKGFFPQQDTGRLAGPGAGPAAHLVSVPRRESEVVSSSRSGRTPM